MEEMQNSDIKNEEKIIDIRKLIEGKNPSLLKILPNFFINYLKKIIHEDDVNYEIKRTIECNPIEFANMVLEKFKIKVEIIGEENIPKTGRYILAANHPVGSIDSCAIISIIGQYRSDMYFLANDLLANLPSMKKLLVQINKHGSNTENFKIINEYFVSDALMLFFPAGLVSRKKGKVIKDTEWKKTFITKARNHKRDVVPVYIEGKLSPFFYNFYKFRKFIGIKQNIEMLYLVNEMYKQENNDIKLIFGKPISYTKFDKKHNDKQWAQIVKEHVYAIGNGTELTL